MSGRFLLGLEIPPADQPALLASLERAVRERTDLRPRVGLVLGSGLGGLADALELKTSIPFEELPGWPAATAPGHAGRLLFGRMSGVPVVIQQGRFHLYEGHSAGFVVQPVLLMGKLGVRVVVLTNAAGGVNPEFGTGTLMAITDHLNLTGRSPLVGPNAPDIGARFPDMTTVWDVDLRLRLHTAADAEGVALPGEADDVIIKLAAEKAAELIVLGTHGRTGFGKVLLGSVSERVIGKAKCAVLVVKS